MTVFSMRLAVVATADDDDRDEVSARKSLKTASSRRKIPLHPQFIAIGFLRFVESRKKTGSGSRLFPGLKPDKYGNHASYVRFRDTYPPSALKMEPKQTFYSFRHSWRDALRRIDAQPATLHALGAWSQGKLVSDERILLFLANSKSGKKTVILNAPALEVLAGLDRFGSYVLPGDDPEKPRADLKRPWAAVAKRAGLDGVRIHDLRHTYATFGAGPAESQGG